MSIAAPATETPTDLAPPPGISALPTPSPEQILKDRLDAAEREAAALRIEREALITKSTKLAGDVDELAGKLRDLEKNPLNFALLNLDAGSVLADAGKKLSELSTVVRNRESKGTFTLKITVKPFKGEALVFVPEVKITEPKPEPAQSVYATDGGELSRNDPRQREFGFPTKNEDEATANERKHPELR